VLVERGLAGSRARAQDLIRRGLVQVAGTIETKAGAAVAPGAEQWLGQSANATVHAWMLKHRGGPRPWLVCVHGFGMGQPGVDFRAFRPGSDLLGNGELADRTGAIPHVVDLTDTAALAAVVGDLKVDVLVNCAGVSRPGNILDSSEEDIDELVDVNLRGLLQLTRLVLPGMVERDLGHVINISSIAGLYNFYGHTVYHATKAAVHQISRQLRNDTVGKRIRVTEICPGRVETEIFGRNLGGTPEAMEEAWQTYYEGYESLTTDDIVNALDYAIETPRHVNVGMLELMPTFQVPGGLTFDRR